MKRWLVRHQVPVVLAAAALVCAAMYWALL